MENPLKQTMFVEFFGLPGCGKSTVSHLLAERLREEGFNVSEPSYCIDHQKPIWRKVRKLLLGFYYYILYRELYDAIKEIVRKNGYKETEAFTQIVNIMQKVVAYRKCRDVQIVIWDQGLVQAAISLSLLGYVNAENNLRKLIGFISPPVRTHNVLIDIDENLAIHRMAMRTSNDSRVEKIRDKERKSILLHQFQECVDSIKNSYKGVVIDGSLTIEKEMELLYLNVIKQYSI